MAFFFCMARTLKRAFFWDEGIAQIPKFGSFEVFTFYLMLKNHQNFACKIEDYDLV